MGIKCISQTITTFRGRLAPEESFLVGYGAIISQFKLAVPIPERLSLISQKERKYKTEEWQVFTPRYKPDDTLFKQLVFALKYEGINLLVFKKLFEVFTDHEIKELVQIEPLSQYSRRIWFIYEWLNNKILDIPDLDRGNFVPLIDDRIQFAIEGKRSSRQRIVNNLLGTRDFCSLIYKTSKLEEYLHQTFRTKRIWY